MYFWPCGLLFLSTLSLRRATCSCGGACARLLISIHALLAESDGCGQYCIHARAISIHALLAESDPEKSESLTTYFISIHALLAESDTVVNNIVFVPGKFLSTLSLRRATRRRTYQRAEKQAFLSTLSLRRATRCPCYVPHRIRLISIHALLAESDCLLFSSTAGTV